MLLDNVPCLQNYFKHYFSNLKRKTMNPTFLLFLKGNSTKIAKEYIGESWVTLNKELQINMVNEQSKQIFALDIGTRSVMGMIIYKLENGYKVVDYAMVEHQQRSMLDGQIHDVVAVAKVIEQVKTSLEERHGKLQKVAVAAAGRALKTKRALVEEEVASRPVITSEDVLAMELAAVQLAQAELAKEQDEKETNFYCVGYSVIKYMLDGSEIGSLVGQRGKMASVEVIATFLPYMVVDSLISALNNAGLEMAALTLEPIASINVLIPATMRKLNIALIDIGAGTSDIAITSEGTVIAYGMVPYAGDEITEALTQHYLLDFPVAEELKRKLNKEEYVEFEDILQYRHRLPAREVIKTIQPAIQHLAEQICQEVIRLNGKTPQAVMLIGGGALTVTLQHWVAELLGLPQNRVGIRGLGHHQQVMIDETIQNPRFTLDSPEFVTPIGIALAAEQHPVRYLTVQVNQRPVRLFDLRKLTIADALLASGINIKKLYGKPGLGLSITLNGKVKFFPGTHGEAPRITANGHKVSLHTPLEQHMDIEVFPGENGKDAQVHTRDLVGELKGKQIFINDAAYLLPTIIKVNGEKLKEHIFLKERDRVEITTPATLKELLDILDLDYDDLLQQSSVTVTFNNQVITLQDDQDRITINGKPQSLEASIYPGDRIYLRKNEGKTFQFHDVFRYVDLDLTKQTIQGKRMVLRVNGIPATFDTPIQDGDVLELKFE